MALFQRITGSPGLVRAVPFVVFLVLTSMQGSMGEGSRYWLYAAKTVLGAWMVWAMRPWVPEMKWVISVRAVAAGVGVFVLWVGLEGWYPTTGQLLARAGLGQDSVGPAWNPNTYYGDGSASAWAMVVVRLLGSSLVVPPLEEGFYRSFIYRYCLRSDWAGMSLRQFDGRAFALVAVVFGLAHREWLPGVLCAMVYQGLVLRRGDLGEAMTAHGVTNLLLGMWVVGKGAWHFW